MTAIKTSTVAPKVYENTADAIAVNNTPEATPAPLDSFTVSELVSTLNEMKDIQEKTRRGEIKLGEDQNLLADLEFHINELSDTLSSLESSLKNK